MLSVLRRLEHGLREHGVLDIPRDRRHEVAVPDALGAVVLRADLLRKAVEDLAEHAPALLFSAAIVQALQNAKLVLAVVLVV